MQRTPQHSSHIMIWRDQYPVHAPGVVDVEQGPLDHPSPTEWYNKTEAANSTIHGTTANEVGGKYSNDNNHAHGCSHRGEAEGARALFREERRIDCDDDLEFADPDVVVAERRQSRRRPRAITSEVQEMTNSRSMVHVEGLDLLEAASASRLQLNRRPSSAVSEFEILMTHH